MKKITRRFVAHGPLALRADAWNVEFAVIEASELAPFRTVGATAVVSVRGPLCSKPDCFFDDYTSIRARAAAAFASPATAVVLEIDSPGGEVFGVFDLSRDLRAMAVQSGKRLVAYVDGMAASAGYAIACAADEICGPTDCRVGSIGAIKPILDATGADRAMGLAFTMVTSGARKADGNPHVPTSDGAVQAAQAEVDGLAGLFFELVAETRGLSRDNVAAMQAAQFQGAEAVGAKLLDRTCTFEGVIAMLAATYPVARAAGAEGPMDEEKEKMVTALKKAAAGSDEKMAKAALAMLKAIGAYEGEDSKSEDGNEDAPPKKDEDKKEEAKAESEDEDKKDKEPDGDEAKALAIATSVRAELDAMKDSTVRASIFDARADLTTAQRAALADVPTKALAKAISAIPVAAAVASNTKAAIAGATAPVQSLRGSDQGEQTKTAEQHTLDVQMGLARPHAAVRLEGNKLVLGVMTPDEARARMAAQKGAAK